MTPRFPIPTLRGSIVRLEPLSLDFVDGLYEAANEHRDHYGFTPVPQSREQTRDYITYLLHEHEKDQTVPFVQVDAATGRVVGSTRYLTIRTRPGREFPFAVEIGGTWLAASAQRTGINTEAKLLLFDYAFTTWQAVRVDLKTDARNDRSRAAIGRLGAVFEGILRQSQESYAPGEESGFRDSVYFSVLEAEWPAVRSNLLERLRHHESAT